MPNNRRFPALILLALACAPLLLFAYLGYLNRLYSDDYSYLGKILESGIWESILFLRREWAGDYSNSIVFGLLTPFGASAPSFFSILIILLGLLGVSWLAARFMSSWGNFEGRNLLAVSLAALTLTAIFNGMYSAQTYLWLSATVRYTLPALLLILCFALAAEYTKRLRSGSSLRIAAIVIAAFGFINAGFSEMYMVFQLVFMMFLVACIYLFAARTQRRIYLTLAIAGFLGSLAGLPVQLSAPGVAYRSSLPMNIGYQMNPIRDLPSLIITTLEEILQIAGHQQAFAGFTLILAGGTAAALVYYQPQLKAAAGPKRGFAAKSTALGLLVQLVFIPILWSHSSDNMQVFERFSYGFALVVMLNLALTLAMAMMFWRRGWLLSKMAAPAGIASYAAAMFFVIVGLFALSQLRSIHYRAATYLFVSTLTLLNMLTWQLVAGSDEVRLRQFTLLATLCAILTGVTLAGQTAVALWGQGFLVSRIYTPVTILQMITALFWGLSLGASVKQECFRQDFKAKSCAVLSLLVTFVIASGIMFGHLPHIEPAKENARIWQENHNEILRLIEADDRSVYTKEFVVRGGGAETDLYEFIYSVKTLEMRMRLFYGLDNTFERNH